MSQPDNQPRDEDLVRATRLLIATAPDSFDPVAINAVFDELNANGRAGQTLVALCDITHDRDKFLAQPEGIAAMRKALADWELVKYGQEGEQ